MKIKNIVTFLLIALILTSCAPVAKVGQAETTVPTSRVIPIPSTLTITPTTPPLPTETPKAKFSICPIENYKDCPVTVDNLFDGTYKKWLESLPPTYFDPANINDVQLVHWDNGRVFYQPKNAPNFTGVNAGKEPFNRNRTFGYATYQGNNYLIMPIEYYDRNNPNKNQWIITVFNITADGESFEEDMNIWKNNMKTTPWMDTNTSRFIPQPDPLVALTLEKYPNLKELIDKFVDLGVNGPHIGDRSALDLPGLVLLNFIVKNDGHWFE